MRQKNAADEFAARQTVDRASQRSFLRQRELEMTGRNGKPEADLTRDLEAKEGCGKA